MSYSIKLRANGVYYYRKRVPKDLISKVGKSEITKSLKTRNKADIVKILPRVEIEVQDYFLNLRIGKEQPVNKNSLLFSNNNQDNLTLGYILQKWIDNNNPSQSSISEWKLTVRQFTEVFGKVIKLAGFEFFMYEFHKFLLEGGNHAK